MIRSMTGFGRGESAREGVHFVVELKTVNHRYLEPSIRMSRKLAPLENDLRSLISQKISRGKLDVYVTYERQQGRMQLILHEDALEEYVQVLRQAGQRFELQDDLKISHILKLPEVLESVESPEDTEALWPLLEEAVLQAMEQLNGMRSREGERIQADLLEKADLLEEVVTELEKCAPQVEQAYYQRLEKRMTELLGVTLDPAVLASEAAVFADKCCIDEELVRLRSHIAQLRLLLHSEEPVGRPLDFLLQEFNREANTIASKAGDLSVTQKALLLKKEIEKVREQIQNIE